MTMFWRCDRCGKDSTDRNFVHYALLENQYDPNFKRVAELCRECGKDVEKYIKGSP